MRLLLAILLLLAPLVRAGAPPTLLSDSFGKLTPSSLAAWYNQADNTLNGDGISAVYDKTGQGRDLLQATANNQPLISRADNKGNLLVRSEGFETTWTRIRINAFGVDDSGSAGAGSFANTARTTDPMGGNAADFLQEDASTSSTHALISASAFLYPGNWTAQCYIKRAGRSWCFLNIYRSGACGGYFDVETGAIGNTASSGDISVASLVIEDAGNDWWLCTVNASTASAGNAQLEIFFSTGNGNLLYSGDNTSGLFLWGASLRPASWDSDYIATVATPAIAGLNGYKTAYFDGSNDYLKTAAFTLNQPFTCVWTGLKVWTWAASDALADGDSASSAKLYQVTATPRLTMAAGSDGPSTTSAALGTTYFLASVYNGASSALYLNAAAAATGDTGAGNPGGFTLGALATPANYAHMQSAQVLLYNRALDTNEVAYLGRLSNRQFNLGF